MNVPVSTEIIAVSANVVNVNSSGPGYIGVIGSNFWSSTAKFGWKCHNGDLADQDWTLVGFNDSTWSTPAVATNIKNRHTDFSNQLANLEDGAWIWTNEASTSTSCRAYFPSGNCVFFPSVDFFFHQLI